MVFVLVILQIMREHKNGCEKVKENPRLNGGVSDRRQVEVEVHSLSQSLRTMARTMNVEYEALRTFHRDVYKLLEGADAAFSLYRRIYEAAQNNSKEITSLGTIVRFQTGTSFSLCLCADV